MGVTVIALRSKQLAGAACESIVLSQSHNVCFWNLQRHVTTIIFIHNLIIRRLKSLSAANIKLSAAAHTLHKKPAEL